MWRKHFIDKLKKTGKFFNVTEEQLNIQKTFYKTFGKKTVYTVNVYKRRSDAEQKSKKIVTESLSFTIIKLLQVT